MIDKIFNEDCLEGMKRIGDGTVDFICTDLPFGITACEFDKKKFDLNKFWQEVKRILKPQSSAAMFASGKFTYELANSNFDWYKYKWIWIKNAPTCFVHAKNCPMHKYEEILIFSPAIIHHETMFPEKRMKYFPQGLKSCENVKSKCCSEQLTQLREGGRGEIWNGILRSNSTQSKVCAYGGKFKTGKNATKTQIHNPHPENTYIQYQTGYPSDVLIFNTVNNSKREHPTQKPTDLLEYLIKTYTNEGEIVLDATIGSGSTAVACINTNRHFIGFETEEKFFEIANRRIAEAQAKKAQELFYL